MRKLILFIFAATLGAVPNQAIIGASNTAILSGGLPAHAPFSTVTTWHIDWRITVPLSVGNAWTSFGQSFLDINSFSGYRIRPNVVVAGVSFSYLINDGPDGNGIQFNCPTINFGQDTVLRLQKNPTNMSCETWNVDGSNYQANISNTFSGTTAGLRGTLQLGDASHPEGSLAFLRGYSGAVALNSKPPFGGSGGDLWDYEFNNNLNDSSSNGLNLTRTGTFAYSTAPVYAPACVPPPQTTFRAGQPITGLTGANSFPLNGGSTLTYLWQQVAGNYTVTPPSTVSFTSRSVVSPTLSGLIAGSYTIQLTVTDSDGLATTCSQKYGVVATDANGSVIVTNPVHAQILGPIIAAPSNPWPLYEFWGAKYAQLMIQKLAGTSPYDYEFVNYWDQALPGTITVSNGSNQVIGAGTTFTTTFCRGPGSPTLPKNNTSTSIAVWYPIDSSFGFPSGTTGRRFGFVTSCTDDTHLTASFPTSNGNWITDAFVHAGAGLTYAYVEQTKGLPIPNGIAGWEVSNYPGNYYDNVEALYAEYYRTGIDDYLMAARTLADRWWSYPGIDKGVTYYSTLGSPWGIALGNRSMALTGLFMRNADNPPYDYSPGLRAMTNYLIGSLYFGPNACQRVGPIPTFLQSGTPVAQCGQDVREQGYGLMYVAYDALFDSNPTQAAAAATAVSLDMTYRWAPQAPAPWVQFDQINSNYASWRVGFAATVTPGSFNVLAAAGSTWDSTKLVSCATACSAGNPPSVIWFTSTGVNLPITNAGGESNWYYVVYVNPTTLHLVDLTGQNTVNYAGTGSTVGWEISSPADGGYLGYLVQPYMTGILSRAFYFTSLALATSDPVNAAKAVTFTLQNANWTASTGLNSATKGLYYGRLAITCEPPGPTTYVGALCDQSATGARDLDGEGMNIATFSLLLNPTSLASKTLGDTMMAAMFAGPGDPGYDGLNIIASDINNYMYTSNSNHKWLGYFWGIGGGWSWASARLGGLTPPIPRVVQVSLDFQTASQAVLTLLRPDGTSSQVTCTSSPCPVTIDAREGDHLLFTKYLDAVNHVLIPSQQTIVKAR